VSISWKTKTVQSKLKDLVIGDRIIIANNENEITRIEKNSLGYIDVYAIAHTEYGSFDGIHMNASEDSNIWKIVK